MHEIYFSTFTGIASDFGIGRIENLILNLPSLPITELSDNSGNDSFDLSSFNGNYSIIPNNADPAYSLALGAVNGLDTLDFSSLSQNLNINLTNSDSNNEVSDTLGNTLNWSSPVIIEQAKAGSGNDSINGNSSANFLEGNAGDDVLTGDLANDTLIGGEGNDTANYVASLFDNSSDGIFVQSGENKILFNEFGLDTIASIEQIQFTDAKLQVIEGAASSTQINDILNGSVAGINGAAVFGNAESGNYNIGNQEALILSGDLSNSDLTVGNGILAVGGNASDLNINVIGSADLQFGHEINRGNTSNLFIQIDQDLTSADEVNINFNVEQGSWNNGSDLSAIVPEGFGVSDESTAFWHKGYIPAVSNLVWGLEFAESNDTPLNVTFISQTYGNVNYFQVAGSNSADTFTVDGGVWVNNSFLFGLGGNDVIDFRYGSQTLADGGSGDDLMTFAYHWRSTINGGDGNDILRFADDVGVGFLQEFQANGGAGDDTILAANYSANANPENKLRIATQEVFTPKALSGGIGNDKIFITTEVEVMGNTIEPSNMPFNITGNEGNDSIYFAPEKLIINGSSSLLSIDGGSGTDTLYWHGNTEGFNLNDLSASFKNFEILSMNGISANYGYGAGEQIIANNISNLALNLDAQDITDISGGSNYLYITGDAGLDSMNMSNWVDTGLDQVSNISGLSLSYDVYTQGDATLYVQEGLAV
jgi:Ca2+-binding RTX toxin-like protein